MTTQVHDEPKALYKERRDGEGRSGARSQSWLSIVGVLILIAVFATAAAAVTAKFGAVFAQPMIAP